MGNQFTGFSKCSWVKPVIIFVLLLVLLIPLGFIKSLIRDREFYKNKAEDSIMAPVGGELALEGLVLAVPYRKVTQYKDSKGIITGSGIESYYLVEVPDTYSLSATLDPRYLSRGIFNVPVFSGDVKLQASFPQFQFEQFGIDEKNLNYKDSVLILGVKNKKTFTAHPVLKIDNEILSESLVNAGEASPFSEAVYYNIPAEIVKTGFSIDGVLSIQGGKSLSFVPMASTNMFDVTSKWNSPSFTGGWLPVERNVSNEGFSAAWNISGLSTVFPRMWKTVDEIKERSRETNFEERYPYAYKTKESNSHERVVIDFITPVNSYSQTKRCVTYAILFLAVPFLAIFLCELWSSVRIHPIQYFLIGIADILFYLLLLSLSEHLSFKVSYFSATLGVCIAVLFYASAIFHTIKWGILLSAVQALSYFLLFGILQSEDYALLIGSIGLFCTVVLVMFLTRKVNWYEKL